MIEDLAPIELHEAFLVLAHLVHIDVVETGLQVFLERLDMFSRIGSAYDSFGDLARVNIFGRLLEIIWRRQLLVDAAQGRVGPYFMRGAPRVIFPLRPAHRELT